LWATVCFQNAHDVALLHDQEILAVDLHLGAGPLAEQHPVADADVEGLELAVLVAGPGPTAITSPCWGFSLAVSGMMMPPAVFSSASTRRTTTRSCKGRNFISVLQCSRDWVGMKEAAPERGEPPRFERRGKR
jgi:hypothetical protein